MDPVTIAAIIAAIAGTYMQAKASRDARDRQTQETQRAIARQEDLQRQAEQKAMDTAKQYNTDDRAAKQDEIETNLTQEYTKPVETAQEIHNSQTTTQGNVSQDYTAAKAQSNANQLKMARALAGLMAKTTSAGRLRTDEAINLANSAAGIDRLGSFAQGRAGADQLAINNAAIPNQNRMLIGGLLQSVGTAYLGSKAGGWTGKAGSAAGKSWAGTNADAGITAIPSYG